MPSVEYEIFAAVGKYKDTTGRERTKQRLVGEVFMHSDGNRYIRLDPFFNFAACERKHGSDKLFLRCVKPEEV